MKFNINNFYKKSYFIKGFEKILTAKFSIAEYYWYFNPI